MEDILRETEQLVEAQSLDSTLGHLRAELSAGRAEATDYVLDDNLLLWYAPRGQLYTIAAPQQLAPVVLALTHGAYGHPGVARTIVLIARKYHWPTLKKDVRAFVLSCKCRRRKRAWSKQLAMMPARLLQPWEVLQMDIQDMNVPVATWIHRTTPDPALPGAASPYKNTFGREFAATSTPSRKRSTAPPLGKASSARWRNSTGRPVKSS